jgi:hypothetical protein
MQTTIEESEQSCDFSVSKVKQKKKMRIRLEKIPIDSKSVKSTLKHLDRLVSKGN